MLSLSIRVKFRTVSMWFANIEASREALLTISIDLQEAPDYARVPAHSTLPYLKRRRSSRLIRRGSEVKRACERRTCWKVHGLTQVDRRCPSMSLAALDEVL